MREDRVSFGCFEQGQRTLVLEFCLLAVPLAFVGSIALLGTATAIAQVAGLDPLRWFPKARVFTPFQTVVTVIVGPLIETLLLGGMLRLLRKRVESPIRLAAVAAVCWGVLHGLAAPMWFFGSAWSFFVFSAGYLSWQKRSWAASITAAGVPHALVNLTVVLLTVLDL